MNEKIIVNEQETTNEVEQTDIVTSVAGKTGDVVLVKADVGLGNVDNTADIKKPISATMQTALNEKAVLVHNHLKTEVGLGKVDNTSDINKPVSAAMQIALDDKSDLGHTHLKTEVGLSKVDNTADLNKPISAAMQTALDDKSDLGHLHTKSEVGLGRVDNTTDLSKPVSTATQEALDQKADTVHAHTKADVGLGKVDNTSDLEKPISSAMQTAIDGKANTVHTHTKSEVGLGSVDNTSDIEKPVSKSTQNALNAKVDKISGKDLSTNDYTSTEKTKLAGIESGAQVNTVTSVAGKTGGVELDKADVGLNNVDNTSDLNKPISMAVQTTLDRKANIDHTHVAFANILKNPNDLSGDIIKGSLTVGERENNNDIGVCSFVSGGVPMPLTGGNPPNTAAGYNSAVVGGTSNLCVANGAAIVAGSGNNISSKSRSSIILGANSSSIDAEFACAIMGGEGNEIEFLPNSQLVVGRASAIMGGRNHKISDSSESVIVGGYGSKINKGNQALIVGGQYGVLDGKSGILLGGFYQVGHDYNTVLGKYNLEPSAGVFNSVVGDALVIGCGTDNSKRSNAFRVTYTGDGYFKKSCNSTGADYAEMWEWQDGNPQAEDRAGRFVAMQGDKIRFANTNDMREKIGVISARPAVVGDNYSDEWCGKYMTDIFGRYLTERKTFEAELDEEGNVIREAYETEELVLNPDYDNDTKYISREERPEWDYVGTHGKLVVIDDGTCQVDGFCYPNDHGIATASAGGYYVMNRIDDTHVRIYVK